MYSSNTYPQVSWLPPQHPRAKITVSAEKLQSRLRTTVGPSGDEGLASTERRKPVSVSIKEPATKRRNIRAERREELDPMDPASYSEVTYVYQWLHYCSTSKHLSISTCQYLLDWVSALPYS